MSDVVRILFRIVMCILAIYIISKKHYEQSAYRNREKEINQYIKKSKKGIKIEKKILMIFLIILLIFNIFFWSTSMDYVSQHMRIQQVASYLMKLGIIALAYFGTIVFYLACRIEKIIRKKLINKYKCEEKFNGFEIILNNGKTAYLMPGNSDYFVSVIKRLKRKLLGSYDYDRFGNRYRLHISCRTNMKFLLTDVPKDVKIEKLSRIIYQYPMYNQLNINTEEDEGKINIIVTYRDYDERNLFSTVERFFVVYEILIEIANKILSKSE